MQKVFQMLVLRRKDSKVSTLQVTHFYLGLQRFAYTQAFLWISGSYSF